MFDISFYGQSQLLRKYLCFKSPNEFRDNPKYKVVGALADYPGRSVPIKGLYRVVVVLVVPRVGSGTGSPVEGTKPRVANPRVGFGTGFGGPGGGFGGPGGGFVIVVKVMAKPLLRLL